MTTAFFFDRDGTLNEEHGYVHRWDQFQWRPGAISAIKELNNAGILVIVATNQAGIAHGYYTEGDMRILHTRMTNDLQRHRAWIDAYYHCPHHPLGKVANLKVDCECRKPKPGMILQAIREYGIDAARSVMIGDREGDLQAAQVAGIGCVKLVGKHTDLLTLIRPLVQTRTPRSGIPHDQSPLVA